MHRINAISGESYPDEFEFIEQPSAPVLFLTSATSDISILSETLRQDHLINWRSRIRAIAINNLKHPAQIDHYISTTCEKAQLIVVRIIGGKSYWPYGIESLKYWQSDKNKRKLII